MNQPQTIAHYRIIKQLVSGGFGDTFLVEDTYLPSGKTCVLKQLKPINDNPQIYQLVKERFKREAIILEELGNSHQQIPALKAYFEENGKFYAENSQGEFWFSMSYNCVISKSWD
jgi:serine/threonine protein kinase, bacterial